MNRLDLRERRESGARAGTVEQPRAPGFVPDADPTVDNTARHELAVVRRPVPRRLSLGFRRNALPTLLIACADAAGATLSWLAATILITSTWHPGAPASHALLLFFCVPPVLYTAGGLYPGVALHPADELRRLSHATTLAALLTLITLFTTARADAQTIRTLCVAWLLALLFVPLARAATRRLFARRAWWGIPTLILGAGYVAQTLARRLSDTPGFGLRPIGFLEDSPQKYRETARLPCLGDLWDAPSVAARYRVEHAIVAMPGSPADHLARVISRHTSCFSRVVVISEAPGPLDLWMEPCAIGGFWGLETAQFLTHWLPQTAKRATDALLSSIGLALLSPLFLALIILIRLESRGPALYSHRRIGRDGAPFMVWKFRTMACDADAVLQHALREDPELAHEWAATRKLRNDPRLTRLGPILRKLSLDELPQLWNVLRGDMSLVGPRPIVAAEVHRYGERFDAYVRVRPGITGLWQVSGRNNTSYEERTRLDEYYVRNWSIWLDIYVLARTLRTVVTCEGAY